MDDDHLQLIEDCEQREQRLTDWEREFLDSVRRVLEDGEALTEKQAEKLASIWERVTEAG